MVNPRQQHNNFSLQNGVESHGNDDIVSPGIWFHISVGTLQGQWPKFMPPIPTLLWLSQYSTGNSVQTCASQTISVINMTKDAPVEQMFGLRGRRTFVFWPAMGLHYGRSLPAIPTSTVKTEDTVQLHSKSELEKATVVMAVGTCRVSSVIMQWFHWFLHVVYGCTCSLVVPIMITNHFSFSSCHSKSVFLKQGSGTISGKSLRRMLLLNLHLYLIAWFTDSGPQCVPKWKINKMAKWSFLFHQRGPNLKRWLFFPTQLYKV